jgi:hypothetical protein
MLTESEREWLNNRNNRVEHFCRWCDIYEDCLGDLGAIFCPSWTQKVQLQEAAEFESRVAAKLAEFYHHTTLYLDDSDGQKLRCWETCPARFYCGDSYTHLTCGDAILKTAQIAVEEEMDGEAK